MTKTETEGAAARRLKKISFCYSAAEDRLLARIQGVDGKCSAAWLTQRLAQKTVEVLCSHLDRVTIEKRDASCEYHANGAERTRKEMLLSFRHAAAIVRHDPVAPVPEIDLDGTSLLRSIHVCLARNRVVLTFDLAVGPATLTLNQDHVWQLLQVLLNLFRRAKWPLDAWPSWMQNRDTVNSPGGENGSKLLH